MDLERIKQRAYEIWEQEGRPEGKQQEHWERAMREIEGQSGSEGAGSEGGGTKGPIKEAADAMRGIESGGAEGTDADQFGKQRVEPGVQDERGGGA